MNAIRKEVLNYIEELSDAKLDALRPILRVLVAEEPIIIETDLTNDEKKSIAAGMAEYAATPESFTPLSEVL
jgi:hypothetical protein